MVALFEAVALPVVAAALPLVALALPLLANADPPRAPALPVCTLDVVSRVEPCTVELEGPELAPLAASTVPMAPVAALDPTCPTAEACPEALVAVPSLETLFEIVALADARSVPPLVAPPAVVRRVALLDRESRTESIPDPVAEPDRATADDCVTPVMACELEGAASPLEESAIAVVAPLVSVSTARMLPDTAAASPPTASASPERAAASPLVADGTPAIAEADWRSVAALLALGVPTVPLPDPVVVVWVEDRAAELVAEDVPRVALALPLLAVAEPVAAWAVPATACAAPVLKVWLAVAVVPLAAACELPELAPRAASAAATVPVMALSPIWPLALALPEVLEARPVLVTVFVLVPAPLEMAVVAEPMPSPSAAPVRAWAVPVLTPTPTCRLPASAIPVAELAFADVGPLVAVSKPVMEPLLACPLPPCAEALPLTALAWPAAAP